MHVGESVVKCLFLIYYLAFWKPLQTPFHFKQIFRKPKCTIVRKNCVLTIDVFFIASKYVLLLWKGLKYLNKVFDPGLQDHSVFCHCGANHAEDHANRNLMNQVYWSSGPGPEPESTSLISWRGLNIPPSFVPASIYSLPWLWHVVIEGTKSFFKFFHNI